MSCFNFSLRVARWFMLIAILQVSTLSAYPHNYGQWHSAKNIKQIRSLPEIQETTPTITRRVENVYQLHDGQVEVPYSAITGTTEYQTTRTITVITVGSSFVSTTAQSSAKTPSQAGSESIILTTSGPTAVILPTSTGMTLRNSAVPLSTSCGQPTPNVYISITGSVPFVTEVACSPTITSSPAVDLPTSSEVVMLTTSLSESDSQSDTFSTTTIGSSSTSLIPDSSLVSLTTSAIQTATEPTSTSTDGSAITSLETSGQATSLPFPTLTITTALSSLSLINISTASLAPTTSVSPSNTLLSTPVFGTIATDAPEAQVPQFSTHPVPRLGIQPQVQKLETNKFYSNLYLGGQTAPVFTFPYSVSWSAGGGQTGSYGLAISHTERSQLATGPPKPGSDAGQWAYYANPIGIQSMVLSATELLNGTSLTTDNLEAFSVNANLLAPGATEPTITFPLLQGISFITGIYNDATPLIQSGIGIRNITFSGATNNENVFKYRATLFDSTTWLIYVKPDDPNYAANSFTLAGSNNVQGSSGFSGIIQIAKLPIDSTSSQESTYDASAGTYPVAATVDGTVSGDSGSYSLSWTKGGILDQPLLVFALPHHLQSFCNATSAGISPIELITPTKGMSTAIVGDSWTLNEPQLPTSMGFAPWSPSLGEVKLVSDEAADSINAAGLVELASYTPQQTNTGSTYYDGKALARIAALVYALHEISRNTTLALTGLQTLESAFALHVNNTMTWPLLYESAWGGVITSQTYATSDPGADFGNGYYNDHHFHYGYFVYAASVIAHLNPSWLSSNPSNPAFVDLLIRDYANPSLSDPYFPFSRNFDWYHGHSWAAGLFESFDGKNQESSSEDSMSLYAIKMWGSVTGNAREVARGDLLLAVQARSLRNYYLLQSDNEVQPEPFVGNKAAGILFENKVDHTTYFGAEPEFIEGIHMLPIMPFSTLTRTQSFVGEELGAYNWTTTTQGIAGGWRGIVMANAAIVDPGRAYEFFSNSTGEFELGDLDGGASWGWYLAFSAALGGSTTNGTEGS